MVPPPIAIFEDDLPMATPFGGRLVDGARRTPIADACGVELLADQGLRPPLRCVFAQRLPNLVSTACLLALPSVDTFSVSGTSDP